MGTLLDAATGSRLISCGVDPTRAALDGAEVLLALHDDDRSAGAQWLTAATFSATEHEALREAIVLACSFDLPVMASLGPYGSPSELRARAELCLKHGAQLIALETFIDDERLCEVLRSMRGLPTLASYCPLGNTPHAAERFLEAGASSIGVNCGDDLEGLVDAAIALVPLGANVVMRPSAGVPNEEGEHAAIPFAFAEALRRGWDAGVHAAGGCCGVQATHLRAAEAVRVERYKRSMVTPGGAS
ncbi:MAG: methionine synthase I (cobalamin-dependent) [Polyangiales bacterium]|jgi:methionine synthase I (cobalamin-dependent)